MTQRLTQTVMRRKFEAWAKNNNLSTVYSVEPNKANVGAVLLDHNSTYGGYQINQLMNEGGGEHNLTERLSANELEAWFFG